MNVLQWTHVTPSYEQQGLPHPAANNRPNAVMSSMSILPGYSTIGIISTTYYYVNELSDGRGFH
jgi:hypothetical protein